MGCLGGSPGGGGRGAAALMFADYDSGGLYIIGGECLRQRSNSFSATNSGSCVEAEGGVKKSENGRAENGCVEDNYSEKHHDRASKVSLQSREEILGISNTGRL